MWLRSSVTPLLLALLACSCGEPARPLSELELELIDGGRTRPLGAETGEVHALVFITDICPIANGYAPEIGRIVEDYGERGVSFTLVHVDRELDAGTARTHRDEHAFAAAVAIDREHALVEALDVQVTPEAFVLRREGEGWQRWYRGRIDDQVTDFGKKRIAAGSPDLRDALDAALAGRPAEPASTRAVGCPVPREP